MGEQCSFSLRRDLTPGLIGSPTREICVCLPLDNCFDEDLNGWDINNWDGCFSATRGSTRKTHKSNNTGSTKQETVTPPQLPAFIREMNQPTEKTYKFRHFVDTRQHMSEYRRRCVVQDANLQNTSFGFDADGSNTISDPYEFKIWKYRELFNRLDSILQTNPAQEKLDEKNFWTRIVETLRARTLQSQRARDRARGDDFLAKFRHDHGSLKPRHPGKFKESYSKHKHKLPNTTTEFKELQLPIIQSSYASLALTVAATKKSDDTKSEPDTKTIHLQMTEDELSSDSSSPPDTPPPRPHHPPPDTERPYCVEEAEAQAMNSAKSCLDLLYGPPTPNVKFPFSVQIVHDVNGVQGSKRSYQPPLRRSSSVPLKEIPPVECIASYRLKNNNDSKEKKKIRKSSDQSDKYVTAARENFEKAREKFFGSRPNTSSNRNQPSVASVREWDLQKQIEDADRGEGIIHKKSSSFVSETSNGKSAVKEKIPWKQPKQEIVIREIAIFEAPSTKITDLAESSSQEKDTSKQKASGQVGKVRWESSLIAKPKIVDNGPSYQRKSGRSENLPQIEYRSRIKIEDKVELQEKLQASLRLLPLNNDNENKEKPKKPLATKNPTRPSQIKVKIMDISDTKEHRRAHAQDTKPTKLGIKGQATGPEKKQLKPGGDFEHDTEIPKNRKIDTSTPRDKLVDVPKFLPTQIKIAELNTVIVEGHPYVTEDQHKALVNAKARTG